MSIDSIFQGQELQSLSQALREEEASSAQFEYADENSLTENEFKVISPASKEKYEDLFAKCDHIEV